MNSGTIKILVTNKSAHRITPTYLDVIPKCKDDKELEKFVPLCVTTVALLNMNFGEILAYVKDTVVYDITTTPDYKIKKF